LQTIDIEKAGRMTFNNPPHWNLSERKPSLNLKNKIGLIEKYLLISFLIGTSLLFIFVQASISKPQLSSKGLLEVQFKFNLIDLEDYDETQFHESLRKHTPLFKRLVFFDDQKFLEIVYAKPQEGSIKQGVVVEITLPSGPCVDIEIKQLVNSAKNLHSIIFLNENERYLKAKQETGRVRR
jgi:hypothetical protein